MRGPRLVRSTALVAAIATVAFAAPALAVTLTPTHDPLPGSTFQGGDGTQVAGRPGVTDWADRYAQGLVLHAPDPNADDDAFGGGSKDGSPGDWSFKVAHGGVSPGGTNILDGYASIDQVNGTSFLYLGGTRYSDTGTSYLSFELNRDSRLWNNGKALIPCRRAGDLAITYLPQGSGQQVTVQRWVTSTADTTTGCARTGTLTDVDLRANVEVQGAFNSSPIASPMPGQAAVPLATRIFGETALNLTSLLSTLGGSCRAFTSFWAYSHSSSSATSNMSDIVWPRPLDVRTCSASGTKFLDVNADGIRQDDEPGLEGFKIFADYDDDGVLDADEPFAYTDAQGNYIIDGIERTSYTLREATPTGSDAAGWRCSFPSPCAWPVDRIAEPYAQGRDFGNWRPAHLTLEKRVFPEDDTTRFTFHHPGRADPFEVTGGSAVGGDLDLKPGTYSAGEVAAPGFTTHVTCEVNGRTVVDAEAGEATLTLVADDRAVCRFYNTRVGTPGIELVKSAPERVAAGDAIHYTLHVTNVGTVAFDAADVRVEDPGCSDPRHVGAGAGDATLDPGDTWTFTCTRETDAPDDACLSRTVTNTATVTADDVSDSDTADVEVRCPRPEIALQKVGPATAPAGSVARFVFYVFNTGDTRFPTGGDSARTAGVSVADAKCDGEPAIGEKLDAAREDDPSPESFDPGDVWAFTCLSTMPDHAPDGTCKDFISTNTATARADTDRLSATTRDSFDTTSTCTPPGPPPQPPAPPVLPLPDLPVPPSPDGPTLLAGTGNQVPSAGVSGTAGARIPSLRRCLQRGSRVVLGLQRAASLELSIGGKRVRGIQIRPLQSRIVIHVRRDIPPGRHRISALIRFQRGAATKPLRFSRVIRGCAAARRAPAPPAVTGRAR